MSVTSVSLVRRLDALELSHFVEVLIANSRKGRFQQVYNDSLIKIFK